MSHQVSFRLTWADLRHLDMHGRLALSIKMWSLVALMVGFFTYVIWRDQHRYLTELTGLSSPVQLPLIFVVLFVALLSAALVQLYFKWKPLLAVTQSVGITSQGFEITDDRGTTCLFWRDLPAPTTDRHGIYVTAPNGARFIVPSHAFASPDALEGFLSEMHEHLGANCRA